jgi:hypothetical protein
MRLTSISYGRTVSDNNYGSFRLEATVELDEGDNGKDALIAARRYVHHGLGIPDPKGDAAKKEEEVKGE